MEARRRTSSSHEVEAALQDLDVAPMRIRASNWPADLLSIEQPGLYSWWVDESGASDLSAGIGAAVRPGRIYAGQAGATKWPSGKTGKATLKSRIGSNHLRGTVRGSTFRRTLAGALLVVLSLDLAGASRLAPESEQRLSAWMTSHLSLAVHPFPDRDALGHLESQVLGALDPPLNIEGRPPTPLRIRVAALRRTITTEKGPPPKFPGVPYAPDR